MSSKKQRNSMAKWHRNGSDVQPFFDDPASAVQFIQDKSSDIESEEEWSSPVLKSKSKSRLTTLEKSLIAILLVLIVVILALASAGTFGYYYAVNTQVCLDARCVEVSADVLKMMDVKTDPCTDFYQYSCGGFLKDVVPPAGRSKWSYFGIVYEKNQEILKKELETPGNLYRGTNNSAITKAKNYYGACMNKTAIALVGATPMLELIGNLGSWTLTSDRLSGQWQEAEFNLIDRLTKAHKLGASALFNMAVGTDDKDSSNNVLQIDQSGLGLDSQDYYFSNDTAVQREAYKTLFMKLAILLGADQTQVQEKVEDVFSFETKLASIFTPAEEMKDPEMNYHKITIKELSQLMPVIDLKSYLDEMFGPGKVKNGDEIIVYSPHYFESMSQLVENTTKSTLTDYIMFQSISRFMSYLSDPFIDILMEYVAATQGVSDLPPRWKTCVSHADSTIGFATGALFVQEEFPSDYKAAVEDMVNSLKVAFQENLPTVTWMDEITQQRALDKLNKISDKIGYPSWLEKPDKLEEYYEKLDVTPDLFFKNGLQASYFYIQKNLDKLGKPVDRSMWDMVPAEVNAYYDPARNEIAFPAGILQKPFYSPSFSMSINFGRIGMVIGHELTHGFDSSGRHFDEYGNLVNWWQNSSAVEFDQHSQCIIEQYDQYPIGSIHLNGESTLNENIADNGGIKVAYMAYKHWVENNPVEKPLPALDLTPDQLFFVGHAQLWCTYYTPEYAMQAVYTDVHSNSKYRVIGVDSNFPAFSAAFNCPVGSPMNPEKKCSVW